MPKLKAHRTAFLSFKHLDFNSHLDFDIWFLLFGIRAMRLPVAPGLLDGPEENPVKAPGARDFPFSCD
jgi:hypothetical protein